ncbi:MAG: M20/M25/M40 family metallo-hydrolase [Pseudomonadota bacterium]|nr:M20/M25/M40 family metallo-hydrolase [Pseudomonadota bacterium]
MADRAGFLRLNATLCGILGLSACAGHKTPPPSNDIDEAGFRDAVRVLASDEFEGRRPGTTGEEKTLAYVVAQFRKLGLKPGNGESYLQPVPLVELVPVGDAALRVTGRGAAKALSYGNDMVIWTQREVAEASLRHSALVFLGYGIVAPEYGWNDYAGIDVHGKTVVVMVNDPGHGSKDPKLFKGNAETYYGRWTYKVEQAARQGAAGILLIHDTDAAGYGWNVVLADSMGPQLEPAETGNATRPAIEGWVSGAAARALFVQAGLDFDALTAAAARPGFKAVDMALVADATVHSAVRRFTSANVVAWLPGAGRKHEYVTYTAHWDHLGRQPAQAGGAILNGAVDDASGVAGLLMLAQSFGRTQPRPDRSIVFIAFTAEEAALLGSAYFVEHPTIPLRQIAAVLNLDTLHIGGPTRDVRIIGFGNSELEEYLREAALLQGREVRPDPSPEQGLYYRSDQFSFAKSGVPALYAKAGVDDAARGPAWGRAQLDDYLATRYHQPGDKYSAEWDVRGTLDDLRLYYEVGNRLARSRRFPRWYPTSEFRAGSPPEGAAPPH